MKEYKLSRSQKIKEAAYVIIICSTSIGIGIYSQVEGYLWMIAIIFIIMTYSVYTTLDYKIILYDEKISIGSYSVKKILDFSEIKNISIDGDFVTIYYRGNERFNFRKNIENHSELLKDIGIIKRKYGI